MNCKNCQTEMDKVVGIDREECSFSIFWCSDCGTVYDEEQDDWLTPCKTKKLVEALIKANDRASNSISKVNRMIDDQRDELGYADRDR